MHLTIPDSLMLLALKDDTGSERTGFIEYGIAGAAVAELLLMERLAINPNSKSKLDIKDETPVDDLYLNVCLESLIAKGSGKDAQTYVNHLARKRKLKKTQKDSLVERGILKSVDKSFLIINWSVYPEADPVAEQQLKARLADVMFQDAAPTEQDSVIIAVASKLDLLRQNFDKTDLKANKDRIKALCKGDFLPTQAACKAIEAVQIAVIIAISVPAVIAATS